MWVELTIEVMIETNLCNIIQIAIVLNHTILSEVAFQMSVSVMVLSVGKGLSVSGCVLWHLFLCWNLFENGCIFTGR